MTSLCIDYVIHKNDAKKRLHPGLMIPDLSGFYNEVGFPDESPAHDNKPRRCGGVVSVDCNLKHEILGVLFSFKQIVFDQAVIV